MPRCFESKDRSGKPEAGETTATQTSAKQQVRSTRQQNAVQAENRPRRGRRIGSHTAVGRVVTGDLMERASDALQLVVVRLCFVGGSITNQTAFRTSAAKPVPSSLERRSCLRPPFSGRRHHGGVQVRCTGHILERESSEHIRKLKAACFACLYRRDDESTSTTSASPPAATNP
ncbi:hypothetical protein CMQ_1079 [Grosmannia clavigera kw1407]|uniref:Uncharacterized protein n=1 Tax=Grosmannia clavigera (strain kw1407 / UAMH 11150) TaxID=655863 RepID=F0XD05_GROCL|nr:uncharacterized protein CMQ_1079 [Grosmannia clavigera kw1407]EFX04151.1 hypothetical protein CMQ_1079 [Grosmannia clavigera kw1407]